MSIKQGFSVGITTIAEQPDIRQISLTIWVDEGEQTIFSIQTESVKDMIILLRTAIRRVERE